MTVEQSVWSCVTWRPDGLIWYELAWLVIWCELAWLVIWCELAWLVIWCELARCAGMWRVDMVDILQDVWQGCCGGWPSWCWSPCTLPTWRPPWRPPEHRRASVHWRTWPHSQRYSMVRNTLRYSCSTTQCIIVIVFSPPNTFKKRWANVVTLRRRL